MGERNVIKVKRKKRGGGVDKQRNFKIRRENEMKRKRPREAELAT